MKILRRVSLTVFALAVASFVKQDLLEGHGITAVYAHANCVYNQQSVPSGSCDPDGQGYCFEGNWYVPGYDLLPDGSTAPTCN